MCVHITFKLKSSILYTLDRRKKCPSYLFIQYWEAFSYYNENHGERSEQDIKGSQTTLPPDKFACSE